MSKYFISYSRKDIAFAEKLRMHIAQLDSKDLVFIDVFDMNIGDKWENRLKIAVSTCDYFILILSKNSTKSIWVNKELRLVRSIEMKAGLRKLFVLRIDDVDYPKSLSAFQILDFSPNFIIGFFKLMYGIRSGQSFFVPQHEVEFDREGYWIKLWVGFPETLKKRIDSVEYRFDSTFNKSSYVDAITSVLASKRSLLSGFKLEFWTDTAFTVIVVIYLKNGNEIYMNHRVDVSEFHFVKGN